jgi:hypothetical protein
LWFVKPGKLYRLFGGTGSAGNLGRFAAIKGLLGNSTNNSTGDLAFSTRNGIADSALTERMRITFDGNVGLGTTTPSQRLAVQGNAYISGTSFFGGSLIATSTLQFTNFTNGLLAVNGSGNVYTTATSTWTFASSTLLADSNTFSGSNIFSSLLRMTSGLLATASSTIGNGTQAGGLTISGGATTTGDLLVQGTATSTFAGALSLGNDTIRAYKTGKFDIGDFSMTGAALNVYKNFSGAAGTLAMFQGDNMANNASVLGVNGSVTGSINALSASISASSNLYAYLDNAGAGNSVFRALVEGAGDPKTQYEINGGQSWATGIDNSDSDSFKISGSANLGTNDYLTITTGGNVGVGTTNPTVPLHVVSRSPAGGIASFFDVNGYNGVTISTTTSGYTNLKVSDIGGRGFNIATHPNDLTTADAYLANIASGYGVGVTLSTPMNNDSNYLVLRARGDIPFATISGGSNPLERMRITSTGNIGIGTTSPFRKLSVAGDIFANDSITGSNLIATGTLAVTGNTTLAQATSTSLAVTSLASSLALANATGGLVNYAGTSCTNQFTLTRKGWRTYGKSATQRITTCRRSIQVATGTQRRRHVFNTRL